MKDIEKLGIQIQFINIYLKFFCYSCNLLQDVQIVFHIEFHVTWKQKTIFKETVPRDF